MTENLIFLIAASHNSLGKNISRFLTSVSGCRTTHKLIFELHLDFMRFVLTLICDLLILHLLKFNMVL